MHRDYIQELDHFEYFGSTRTTDETTLKHQQHRQLSEVEINRRRLENMIENIHHLGVEHFND